LTGAHAIRPPLLQPVAGLHESDVVSEYQRALAAGDVEAAVATFEPDGYMLEPAGGEYIHRGPDELRALYRSFFANGGGIPLEHCAVTDDGRACALEYNVVAWGRTELPPEVGIAVYVRGDSGKLAIARVYDDSQPPLS
jgi:SnoaL-like domain